MATGVACCPLHTAIAVFNRLCMGRFLRSLGVMHWSAGPSVRLVFALADGLGQVGAAALEAAWKRWIGHQRFHRKVAQLARCGLVERTSAELGGVIRLTAAGRITASGGRDPDARWQRMWDGRWRLVLFDVPETAKQRRESLRRTLRRCGFGYLQNSAWISPDPLEVGLRDAADAVIDAETLSTVEARPCAGETDAQIVSGAWDFKSINRRYELYVELLNSRPSQVASRASKRSWLSAEWRAWRLALGADPLLPERLLPDGYLGREAWKRRNEVLRHALTGS